MISDIDEHSVGSSLFLILKVSAADKLKIQSRENSTLEFKANFDWRTKDKYARTLAAFANAKGGRIVFGISNKPRAITGLNSQYFEEFDPATISEYLNDHFSPEMHWDMSTEVVSGRTLGVISIREGTDKPIICTKNDGQNIKNGDIYYRYRGRSEKIKYPEMRAIVDGVRRDEQRHWEKNIKQIARIGVKNAAVLDTVSGSVVGPSGTFLIDEALLSQVAFINEGEFSEVVGAPAIRLIGEAQVLDSALIQPTRTRFKQKTIRTEDIVLGFLDRKAIDEPLDYLIQICHESSGYLPFYYYMKVAGLSPAGTLSAISGVTSRMNGMATLVRRLSADKDFKCKAAKNTVKSIAEMILRGEHPVISSEDEKKDLLRAIRSINAEHVNPELILPILKKMFLLDYRTGSQNLAQELRDAICFVDLALNSCPIS